MSSLLSFPFATSNGRPSNQHLGNAQICQSFSCKGVYYRYRNRTPAPAYERESRQIFLSAEKGHDLPEYEKDNAPERYSGVQGEPAYHQSPRIHTSPCQTCPGQDARNRIKGEV